MAWHVQVVPDDVDMYDNDLLWIREEIDRCEHRPLEKALSNFEPERSIFHRIPDQQGQSHPFQKEQDNKDHVHHVHIEVHMTVDVRHEPHDEL